MTRFSRRVTMAASSRAEGALWGPGPGGERSRMAFSGPTAAIRVSRDGVTSVMVCSAYFVVRISYPAESTATSAPVGYAIRNTHYALTDETGSLEGHRS